MRKVLETARLILREHEAEDAPALYRLNSDPEVMRFTGEPSVESLEAMQEIIANYTDFEEHGYGRWVCVLESTGECIGFCGLKYLPELGETDLGYRFFPEHWGMGYATESSRAVLDYGFRVLGLDRVIALVLPENERSIRVAQRLDMAPAGEVEIYDCRALKFVAERPTPSTS